MIRCHAGCCQLEEAFNYTERSGVNHMVVRGRAELTYPGKALASALLFQKIDIVIQKPPMLRIAFASELNLKPVDAQLLRHAANLAVEQEDTARGVAEATQP